MPETKPVPPPPATEDAGLPTPPSPGRLPPPHLPPPHLPPPPADDGSSRGGTDGPPTE